MQTSLIQAPIDPAANTQKRHYRGLRSKDMKDIFTEPAPA